MECQAPVKFDKYQGSFSKARFPIRTNELTNVQNQPHLIGVLLVVGVLGQQRQLSLEGFTVLH